MLSGEYYISVGGVQPSSDREKNGTVVTKKLVIK